MTSSGHLLGASQSSSRIAYGYSTPDDVRSIRRWLQRNLSPSASATSNPAEGEPWIYGEAVEGTFQRPAVTVTLVTSTPSGDLRARTPSYTLEHALSFAAYGRDRPETIRLAGRMLELMLEGGVEGGALTIPMWAFELGAQLAQRMRVVRPSLSMGLEETDQLGGWVQRLEARVTVPRVRPAPVVPRLGDIRTTFVTP